MKVRISRRAARDLSDIADYIRARNPSAALRVRDAILDSLNILTRFPNAGRQQGVEDVRKLIVPRYPYLIYYTVAPAQGEAVVVAIQHAAQEREYSDL
ncbi:MAG: type II toxin-antitoxin system RelE/ParE family toxin [Alphaproteobacteria bacterium]|nr:type II toxin-antitoxin system RelE/ParE family toxin [Alphaproteobacteria bacterium]